MNWQPFPTGYLPECAGEYVRQAAEVAGCDMAQVALPLLASLGTAIGNSRVVRLKKNWTEPPVLWTMVVAESGTRKSLAFEMGTALLRERHEWATPPPRVLFDPTPTGLAAGLTESPRGLLMVRADAANWLRQLGAKGGGESESDLAAHLAMYRAESLNLAPRAGSHKTAFVSRAFVAVAGGMEVGQWEAIVKSNKLPAALAGRLLVAMPPRRPRRWSEMEMAAGAVTRLRTVHERLWSLAGAEGISGCAPVEVGLDDEAKAVWLRFFQAHGEKMAGRDRRLAAIWSKLEGYCARLALIIHLTHWADNSTAAKEEAIHAISMDQAARLTEWFATEAERVHGLFAPPEAGAAGKDAELIQWISDGGGRTTARQVVVKFRRRFPTVDHAEDTLRRLRDAGTLVADVHLPGPRGGTPTVSYRLNPDREAARRSS